jgi:HEAT repeat protein
MSWYTSMLETDPGGEIDEAGGALGKIADLCPAPALHAALSDISPRVRANAATALGRLGVTDAGQWLSPHLSDPDPAVRSAVEAAIRRLREGQG